MPTFNTKFELSLEDMEMIEQALLNAQSKDSATCPKSVNDLLGRLHNQKVFYRPKGTYVSG